MTSKRTAFVCAGLAVSGVLVAASVQAQGVSLRTVLLSVGILTAVTAEPNAAIAGANDPAGTSRCVDNTWAATRTAGAPDARYRHAAVWTGSEAMVWGGGNWDGPFDTGGRYDPTTDTWTAISTVGAPSGRTDHTAVWTGTERIVWGGGLGAGV